MKSFEYLLLFTVIIAGLAVADLAVSVQRLLAGGKKIKWDVLSPLAGLLAFTTILAQWWGGFGLERVSDEITFGKFLLLVTSTTTLFLMSATALPDDFGEKPINLASYYGSISRRFWLLFLLHWVLATVGGVWAATAIHNGHFSFAPTVWLSMPLALSFLVVRNRWWHGLGMVGLIVLEIAEHLGRTLVQ